VSNAGIMIDILMVRGKIGEVGLGSE
jgi:hypothetical protein